MKRLTFRRIAIVIGAWLAISTVKFLALKLTAIDPAFIHNFDGFASATALWWVFLGDDAQGMEAAEPTRREAGSGRKADSPVGEADAP